MPLSDHANRWTCFVESCQRLFYDLEKGSSGCGPPANPCMDLVYGFSHTSGHESLAGTLANLLHNYGVQLMSDGWEHRQTLTGHAGKLLFLLYFTTLFSSNKRCRCWHFQAFCFLEIGRIGGIAPSMATLTHWPGWHLGPAATQWAPFPVLVCHVYSHGNIDVYLFAGVLLEQHGVQEDGMFGPGEASGLFLLELLLAACFCLASSLW